jgi:hypothetical protein
MMTLAFTLAAFGFGLCLGDGLFVDGLTGPWTAYFVGWAFLLAGGVTATVLGARQIRREQEGKR